MFSKTEITKIYKKKVKELKKHNKFYHTEDKPIISDSEFDQLKKEILDLEKENDFLTKLSLNTEVGAPPSNKFKKIKHLKPMLSLTNAFDKEDMKDFANKIKNFLNFKDEKIEFSSEPKIDGISATLIYENGNLTKGLSRGDGLTGEDILENLKTIQEIPKKIKSDNIPSLIEVRCEIYIGKKISIKLKENLQTHEMSGGSLRQKKIH